MPFFGRTRIEHSSNGVTNNNQYFQSYRKAASFVLSTLTTHNKETPKIGIICGSGLSGLSSCMTDTLTISYASIPGFPDHTTVEGHKNDCVVGYLENVPTICFRGRFHFYEGHEMNTVVLPVRLMRAIGVKLVFITNAAGGLNPLYNVGDIVCIMDHLCIPMMAGHNPLMGPNDTELGPRFPPMSNAYDEKLQSLVLDSAKRLDLEYKVRPNGVYCFVSGPMYESKAECRYLRSVGGDAVGMSTIPEIAAAHHSGMKVLCLSVITNKVVVSDGQEAANHDEVLTAVNQCSQQIQALITDIIVNSDSYLLSLPDLPLLTTTSVVPHEANNDPCADDETAANGSNKNSRCSVGPTKIIGIPLHCLWMSSTMMTVGAAVAVMMLRRS